MMGQNSAQQREAAAETDSWRSNNETIASVDSSSNNNASRRSKTTVACGDCRQRKVKCDGVQPRCGACRRRRTPASACVYKVERVKTTYSASYVAALEGRLRILESAVPAISANEPIATREISHVNSSSRVNPSPLSSATQDNEEQRQHYPQHRKFQPDAIQLSSSYATFPSRISTLSPHDFFSQKKSHSSSHSLFPPQDIDAMGNLGTHENAYPEGSSSAASFTKQVKEAVASRLSLSGLGTSIVPDFARDELLFPQRLDPVAELCVLPPRNEADVMMDIFWNQAHVFYPLIDYESFQEDYEKLWHMDNENTSRTTHILLCRLNAIFASACQLRRRITADQGTTPDVFFRRASQLFQISAMGNGSLEIIQACLYLATYLQSTEYSYQCWIFIGFAIRTAQSIGLHLPESAGFLFEKESDRRLSQRLWNGCVFLDRMIAMTLGRPMTISKTDGLAIPLPPRQGNEHVFSPSTSSVGRDVLLDKNYSKMDFFSEGLKLFQITGDMLATIYSRDKSSPFAPRSDLSPQARLDSLDFNAMLRIDNALHRWRDALPSYLQMRSVDSLVVSQINPIQLRQSIVLHLRFLQIRILLFRPILALLLTSEANYSEQPNNDHKFSLSRDMAIPCAQRCIASAISMIDVIWTWRKENCEKFSIEPLPAWWFLIFYLYNAGVVLIPARRFKALRGHMSPTYLAQYWQRALIAIEGLSRFSPSAKRCLTSLQLLNTEIMREIAVDPELYCESVQPTLPEWYDPTTATMVFPEPEFADLPLDYTWIDSLPIDLTLGNDIFPKII